MKKLSKLLVVLLAMTMIFAGVIGFTACGDQNTPPPPNGGGTEDPGDDEPEVHECSFKCVICEGCLDTDCEEPECATKCGHQTDRTLYDFEGEDPHVQLKGGELGPLGIAKEEDYGATETYIGNFNANPGASIKYTVEAEADGVANLIVSVCKRQAATIFTNVVATLVNGDMMDSPSRVPSNGKTTDTWTEFEDVNLGCVNLIQGSNVIEFAIMDANAGSGYNFNAMRLKSNTPVTWYEGEHKCTTKNEAGKCNDYSCEEQACFDKNQTDWETYEFDGLDTKVEVAGGAFKNENYIGGLNGSKGALVKFVVDAAEATNAVINLSVCSRSTPTAFAEAFNANVNGIALKSYASMPTGGDNWDEFTYVKAGYAKLKKGRNVVTFEVATENTDMGFNVKNMSVGTLDTAVTWFVMESFVDYKFEAEDAASNGWENGALAKNGNNAASGGKCVGHVYDISLSNPGEYWLSFDVYAAEATDATVYLCLGVAEPIKAAAFPLTVNDEDKTVDKSFAKGGWDDFREYEYTTVSLKKGLNTIKITVGEGAIANVDYLGFACETALSATEPAA